MRDALAEWRDKAAQLESKCAQLEKNVVQCEERFRRVFHAFQNPMAITTLKEGRIIDLNQAGAGLSGYSREELIGRLSADFNPIVDPGQKETLTKILQKDGRIHNFEMRLATRSGEERIVLFSADPITVNDEPCLISISIDITERKRAEKALKESEERFRLIAETIDEIFWISKVDGSTVYISPAHDRIWGTDRDAFYDGDKAFFAQIHPEDRDRVAAIGSRLKDGEPLDYEYRIVRPDGSIRHLWNRCYPVPDEDGLVKQYVGVKQDITARWNAEEALKASREYLDQIINSLGDPMFVKDENHRMVLVNHALCEMTGKRSENLLGTTIDTLLPDELAGLITSQEEEIFRTGQECVTEECIPDSQGKIRSMLAKKTLLTDKRGNRHIVGVLRDITDYERLQAQLMHSQKMEAVGLLAGGVAHDFNNLLTVIKGYTEILELSLDPDDPLQQDIGQISKAGQQASALTKQLLAFGRKQILQPKVININATLQEMAKMLRRLIGEDINLSVIAQPGLHSIYADPGQIQQILLNMVINARDAMPQGGRLIIETANVELDESYAHEHSIAKAGPHAMLSIRDTGVGMNRETQAHIFEPFFTTKRPGEGSGLGLATVYGIVRQSGGYIWTYSEPEKGTTFKIYFPKAERKAAPTAVKTNQKPYMQGSETILIVEDDASVRTFACRILQQRGYTILDASDGNRALEVAGDFAGEIHLVISDVVMPGISGKELITRLQQSRPGIKSLYISGYTDKAIVHHGILDSEVAFLPKPFTIESLVHKVQEVIEGGEQIELAESEP